MDIITHFFLSIILSLAWKKRLRWDIITSGIILDADFLIDFILQLPKHGINTIPQVLMGDVIIHGTFTHSILMLPLYALILMKLWKSTQYSNFLAGMGMHLAADAPTYGNMLLWPIIPEYINPHILPAHHVLYPITTGIIMLWLYQKTENT